MLCINTNSWRFSPQVRTFLRNCNGKASCNCAVAVKSGDDIIVIDRCGPRKGVKAHPIVPRLYLNGELTPGTRIIRQSGGRKYQVYFDYYFILYLTSVIFWF